VVPLHDCVPLVVDSSTKKYSFISLCLKPEMWQKVAKFKGAEYFRKALYPQFLVCVGFNSHRGYNITYTLPDELSHVSVYKSMFSEATRNISQST
ncbi:unnamed protein product, partial [Oncorhynchus mykiss]